MKIVVKIGIVFTVIGIMVCVLTGCSAERYTVDYGGHKKYFIGAKNSYKAGQQVELTYSNDETGVSIYFYLDDEKLDIRYDDEMRLVIAFTMPEHDVKLRVDKVAFTAPVPPDVDE